MALSMGMRIFALAFTSSTLHFFFFQAEDGIRDDLVTGVQTCALPILFAWGDTALLARPSAGIVGSRDHSPYGAAAARLLAAGVAGAGVVVVSGMARGIDAIAHAAALDSGGASVGILGNGFGVIYPAVNRALYERMVAHGCLVTE